MDIFVCNRMRCLRFTIMLRRGTHFNTSHLCPIHWLAVQISANLEGAYC